MAKTPMRPRAPVAEQVHIDIGVLAQRVTSVEDKFDALSGQVSDGFTAVATQMRDFTSKMDSQQQAAAAQQQAAYAQQLAVIANNRPDWKGIIGSAAAVAAVFVSAFVVIGSMALSPLRETLADDKAAIGDIDHNAVRADRFQSVAAQQQGRDLALAADLGDLRKTQAVQAQRVSTLEGVLGERQASYLRDHDTVALDLRTLDEILIKRPEIEAANRTLQERAEALSARINDVQAQVNSLFPASKTIDEMWAQLRETRNNAAPPLIPLAPAAPPRPTGN